jgi:lipopolysaccharide biosynthesis protein
MYCGDTIFQIIHDTLHLDYVLSIDAVDDVPPDAQKVLVLLHLYYIDLLDLKEQYMLQFPRLWDSTYYNYVRSAENS